MDYLWLRRMQTVDHGKRTNNLRIGRHGIAVSTNAATNCRSPINSKFYPLMIVAPAAGRELKIAASMPVFTR